MKYILIILSAFSIGCIEFYFPIETPWYFPKITTTTFGETYDGITFFNMSDNEPRFQNYYIIGVNNSGEVVYFYEDDTRIGPFIFAENGNLLIIGEGVIKESTTDGEILWSLEDSGHFHHEIVEMFDGNIMTLIKTNQDINGEDWAGDKIVILERGTANILWSWETFDHISTEKYDKYTHDLFIEANKRRFDWTHSNGIALDEKNSSIYLSVRNLSTIFCIDFPSGEILYEITGFSFQHAPELQENGNLLVYDNGRFLDETRIVELNPEGEIIWEWFLPTYNATVGDADRLSNGNTLVVAGHNETIHEVDPFGNEVWRMEAKSTLNGHIGLYRAEKE